MKVGFIGLGAMGQPMARHLHAAGLLTAVGNRTRARATSLAGELGVQAPAAMSELATMCGVIALCVSADADVLGLVDQLLPALGRDAIVIDHSTVAPETAREAAKRLDDVGARFVDAPVSGGVEGARNGKLSVMAGGETAAFECVRPVLECYAARLTLMGPVGSGQATKAVNQVLVAGIAEAVCEGLALAQAMDLPPDALLPTLGAGAAGNWFLEKRGASMLRNEFDVGFKLSLLHKDLLIVREIAERAGVAQGVIEHALADFAQLMAQGRGDEDISALIRLKRG